MIVQYFQTNHKTCDQDHVSLIFALNAARHESTGYTPTFLNFGKQSEVPTAFYRVTQPSEKKKLKNLPAKTPIVR